MIRDVKLGQVGKDPNQNVLLLSLVEIEGASDLTIWEPLLLISRPWKRPRESWCKELVRPCTWAVESIAYWWVDMPAGREWNCGICELRILFVPDWGWLENKADGLYGACKIGKLNVSGEVDISPVAILSLSTSCFKASLRATNTWSIIITDSSVKNKWRAVIWTQVKILRHSPIGKIHSYLKD